MKFALCRLLPTVAIALFICGYAPATEHRQCLHDSTSFIRVLVPFANVRVTQSLPGFLRFTGKNVVILADSFGADCLPNHIVVKATEAIKINKPTPSLKVVDVVSVAQHKRIVATDQRGRSTHYDTAARPTISLYRFNGAYHLAISVHPSQYESNEVGIAVGQRGPFTFTVRWPEPGPIARWPKWPAKP